MTNRTSDIESVLPLKPVDFLVLLVLSERERHGYGIVQDIERQTNGTIQLVPGNLYSVLKRLLGLGVIAELRRRPAPDLDDQRRRYYEITGFGRAVLTAEARRMRQLVATAEAKHILNKTEPA